MPHSSFSKKLYGLLLWYQPYYYFRLTAIYLRLYMHKNWNACVDWLIGSTCAHLLFTDHYQTVLNHYSLVIHPLSHLYQVTLLIYVSWPSCMSWYMFIYMWTIQCLFLVFVNESNDCLATATTIRQLSGSVCSTMTHWFTCNGEFSYKEILNFQWSSYSTYCTVLHLTCFRHCFDANVGSTPCMMLN